MSLDQRALPSGTLTFLFTDIQGSTALVQRLGNQSFAEILDLHGRTLRDALDPCGGVGVRTEGDAFFYVFAKPSDAVGGVVAAQRALAAAQWPHGVELRVRMGLHTGEASLGSDGSGVDYVGFDVHRAARIAAAGSGGQVLVSEATRVLVQDRLPGGVGFADLGEHRFKDLANPERVWQLVIAGLPGEFPRIRSLDRTPNNLPTQLTSFIGREREVREGRRLLAGARLLTLTGPGGTGKTRLSLQIAAEAADEFPDGVYFVALASIEDPSLVMSTVAHDLGLQTSGQAPPLEVVVEHLKQRRVLIVLDNFEQLLAAAPQVGELLRACPRVVALVSSRAPLHVYGEQELPVPPLALPDPAAVTGAASLSQYEAVRLFIERALAAKPDFAVTNENAPAVAGICARLDGLPLAIELAAARVRLLPPQAILARLAQSSASLGGGARDLPARQQTLRGAIAWSYDLLDATAQRLFRRFSCHVGGAGLAEIEPVCGCGDLDTFEILTTLVDHSLVRQRPLGGEPRFHMLQTIREYGLERLAEDPEAAEVHRRHAETYLALVEAAAPHLLAADQKQWLDRVEADHDNLRAAIALTLGSGAARSALRLGAAAWRFWQIRGYLQEARATIERILAARDADQHPAELRAALEAAGGIAYWQGDLAAAGDFYRRGLALSRAAGDPRAIANDCYNLSFTSMFLADPVSAARAREPLTEALGLYRSLGDAAGVAKTLWGIANLEYRLGDYAASRGPAEEALETLRGLDDRFGLGWALHHVGLLDLAEDRLDEAHRRFAEAMAMFDDVSDLSALTLVLGDFSRLAAARGDFERAVRLRGAADAMKARSGAELINVKDDQMTPFDDHGDLAPERVTALMAEGRALTRERAVAYALAPE